MTQLKSQVSSSQEETVNCPEERWQTSTKHLTLLDQTGLHLPSGLLLV